MTNSNESEEKVTCAVDHDEMSMIVDRLITAYQPLRIYLFGSYAWGIPTADSDYDICVVVESSDEKKWDRSQKGLYALLDILRRRSIDLLVYTVKEFDLAATHPSTLASPIEKRGVLLYDRTTFGKFDKLERSASVW